MAKKDVIELEAEEMVDHRSQAERNIMGEKATFSMTDMRRITGPDGRAYTPTDVFSEMLPKQRSYILGQLAPIIPIIIEAIRQGEEITDDLAGFLEILNDKEIVMRALMMLQGGGLRDIRALAALYLPEDDRTWREEDVDTRMELFSDWTLKREWEVISGFFPGIGGSAPGTSPGSSAAPKTKTKRGPFNIGR